MVIQFKDRSKELKELLGVINSKKFEFIVLYGRRRVGKTELILKASESKKRIYYLAVGEKDLDRFYELCSREYGEILKLKKDWEVVLEFLAGKIDVLIIDEFQNMIKGDKNILNIFQSAIDLTLKKSNLKLFLVGSSVSIITSKVLEYQSPLYGRRTGSINLKPVSFFELSEFFPKTDIKQLLDIYGFGDGIPFYLAKIDNEFWEWFKEELNKERSFLRDEVDFLMRYEFEDSSTYKLILEAIANGKTKLNEIKDFINLKRTDIGPYLRNLIEVGMVKREVPVTENIKSRRGRYYLADNFLKFWFRYIYPNLSLLESGSFNTSIIKSNYSSYMGYIFEDVIVDLLKKAKIKMIDFTKMGRWWGKGNEIDAVAMNEQTEEILFAECKWQDKVDAEKVIEELKEKSKLVEWNNDKRKEHFAVFAKSFSKRIKEKDVYLFDLKDIEKGFKQ